MENVNVEIVESVECYQCKKLHKLDGDTFFTVHGNVCIGLGGGVIGNNLDDGGKVIRIVVFCTESDRGGYGNCINKFLSEAYNTHLKS